MKLPMYEEVSEARRLAEEAADAAKFHLEAGGALTSLSMFKHYLTGGIALDPVLPGTDLVERAIDRFPHLRALHEAAPREGAPDAERLHARIQQLQSLQQMLGPIAAKLELRSSEVHRLQHAQHHHLIKPEFADIMAQIDERNALRQDLAVKIADQRYRLGLLRPCHEGLASFLPDMQNAFERTDGSDVGPLEILCGKITALDDLVGSTALVLGLDLGPLRVPELDPQALDRATIGHALEVLQALNDALASEKELTERTLKEHEAAHRQANEWILAQTG
ncbi:MAG: hypothetical protein EA397_20140 [Deltaproteobacteria bacterium]|nr:MAG: hypothetical protein EA397_20140 [Deltaproteobacteria bacterium]